MNPDTLEQDRALGSELRRIRLQRKRTMAEVGALCDIASTTIGAYERGQHAIPAIRLAQLCDLYEVSVADILEVVRLAMGAPTRAGTRTDGPIARFDLDGLTRVTTKEGKLAAQLVDEIWQHRGAVRPSEGVFAIRSNDLFVLSATLGLSREELVQRLRADGALRKPVGRPAKGAP